MYQITLSALIVYQSRLHVKCSFLYYDIILIMPKTICLFPVHPQRAFGFVHI